MGCIVDSVVRHQGLSLFTRRPASSSFGPRSFPGFPDIFWSLRLPHSIWSFTVSSPRSTVTRSGHSHLYDDNPKRVCLNTGIHPPDVVGLTAFLLLPRPVYGSWTREPPRFLLLSTILYLRRLFSWLFNSFVSVFINHPSHVPALAFCNFSSAVPFYWPFPRRSPPPLHTFRPSALPPSHLPIIILPPHGPGHARRCITKGRNLDVFKAGKSLKMQNRQDSYHPINRGT